MPSEAQARAYAESLGVSHIFLSNGLVQDAPQRGDRQAKPTACPACGKSSRGFSAWPPASRRAESLPTRNSSDSWPRRKPTPRTAASCARSSSHFFSTRSAGCSWKTAASPTFAPATRISLLRSNSLTVPSAKPLSATFAPTCRSVHSKGPRDDLRADKFSRRTAQNCLRNRRSFSTSMRMSGILARFMARRSRPNPKAKPVTSSGS